MVVADAQRPLGIGGAEVPGLVALGLGRFRIEGIGRHAGEASDAGRLVANGVVEEAACEVGTVDGSQDIERVGGIGRCIECTVKIALEPVMAEIHRLASELQTPQPARPQDPQRNCDRPRMCRYRQRNPIPADSKRLAAAQIFLAIEVPEAGVVGEPRGAALCATAVERDMVHPQFDLASQGDGVLREKCRSCDEQAQAQRS